jgi:hypothetical protein
VAANTDFVEIALEESPLNEATHALGTTPNRISTNKFYLPARAARLSPAPSHLDRSDELRGITGAVPRLIETYDPAGSLSVRAYADALIYLFSLAGFTGVHTAGDGIITDPDTVAIPTGAHRWVFNKADQLSPQTAQIKTNYKDEDVLLTGNGYALSSLAIPATGEVTADLAGLLLTKAAHDSSTNPAVSSAAIPPFRRGDLFLTWLSGGGVASDFNISMATPLERIRSMGLNPPSYFPDSLQFGDDQVYATGSIPKRVLNGTDYAALLAATTFAAKAKWVSPKVIGATAYKYSMWIEMPSCQYVGGDADEIGNRRRFGASYDFFAAYDESAGYDVKVTIVGSLAAIATYT